MKAANPLVRFFTNWTKKKTILSLVTVLVLLGAAGGIWAAWPYLRPTEVTPTVTEEPVQKELTYYQDLVVSVASSERDLTVSFLDSEEAAIAGQNFSVKLVRVGSKKDVSLEDLNKTTADSMFSMSSYASSSEEQVQEDETDTAKKAVATEIYTAGISTYQQQLDAAEGTICTDEDGDGSIYQEDLEPGIYQVWYIPVDGYFPSTTIVNVEVKDKVERVVDTKIEEKVTPYVASEDVKPARQTTVEKKVTNTTEKVEKKTETVTKASSSSAVASNPYADAPKQEDGSTDTTTVDSSAQLKDAEGHLLYTDAACTIPATVGTYSETATYYYKTETTETLYTGWQTINGKTYYYNANHQKVTGQQTIDGLMYRFNEDGSLVNSLGAGIDVSKWNGTINWNKVKAAGINYVFVRCGGRYSQKRELFEDPTYGQNVSGALAAGLKVGIYFYSTATTVEEAVEEASLAVVMAKKYNITLPIFIDMEDSVMPKSQLTSIAQAFCQTVQSAGYTPGVYSSISWWKSYLSYSTLSSYKIWIARYNTVLSGGNYTWTGRCDYWQYSSTGSVDGVSGNVDLNIAY